jgi:hypothetical protein
MRVAPATHGETVKVGPRPGLGFQARLAVGHAAVRRDPSRPMVPCATFRAFRKTYEWSGIGTRSLAVCGSSIRPATRQAIWLWIGRVMSMAYAIVHYFPGGTRDQYEVTCSGAPKPGQPPGWPDIPCCRTFGGRLDHHGCARFQGELGAVSRPNPDPAIAERHRRGIERSLAGNGIRGIQPAKVRCRLGACLAARQDYLTSLTQGSWW